MATMGDRPQRPLELALLGPLEVRWHGDPVPVATTAGRALLGYLAVESGRAHPRDLLARMLWPELPQAAASNNLRQTVFKLRAALPDAACALRATRTSLQFAGDPDAVDVVAFERLLAECAVHDHAVAAECVTCAARLEQAAALYRGELLEGLFLEQSPAMEEWLLLRREQLHRRAVDLRHALAEAAERAGDPQRMLVHARAQVALEPTRERAHRQVMRALVLAGERVAALGQYETCRRILDEELGIAPERATTDLYERIRSARTYTPATGAERANVPEVDAVHGRVAEAATLRRWLVDDGCRLVAVLGIGGVGKTTLAAAVAADVAHEFDVVVWRSLVNAPDLATLLATVLPAVGAHRPADGIDARLDQLLDALEKRRCLLVLDNAETLLEAGRWRAGHAEYGQLLALLAQRRHRGCTLVTSREQPADLARLPSAHVRSLPLAGLDGDAGCVLLGESGVPADQPAAAELVQRYSGNPLAIKLVARTVQDLFGGDVGAFLATESPIFDDIRTVLDQQFDRLGPLEREVLTWLAVQREPLDVPTLRSLVVDPGPSRQFLEALRALQRRSLLERSPAAGVTLQNVIIEYVTDRLVDEMCAAVVTRRPQRMNRHALLDPTAPEYVRASQGRLLLAPVAERLRDRLGLDGVAAALRGVLAAARAAGPRTPGYAAGNALNIALHLGLDVRGWDLSDLCVWHADLRNAVLADVDLSGADLTRSAFTECFGVLRSLAPSPDGRWLAAGADDRCVRIWHTDGVLHHILSDAEDQVLSVAFAPDARTVAGAGKDRTIRIWEVHTGRLVRTLHGHEDAVHAVAFAPDGRSIASGGYDGTLRLWDAVTGECRWAVPADADRVWTVAFAPDARLVASGGVDGPVRLWDVATGTPVRTLGGHAGLVAQVVFSPDGRWIVSGGEDRTIRLWDPTTGAELRRLGGHERPVTSLALAPDGRRLASASLDRTVRLWDTRTWRVERVLHDHTDGVDAVAFAPDGATLTSASGDMSVRTWDTADGQCLAIRRGYTRSVIAIAFAPDGATLASGGFDHRVHLWNPPAAGRQAALRRILSGHAGVVADIDFSRDGTLMATGGTDRTVRLWDTAGWWLRHVLDGFAEEVTSVSLHPSGALVAASGEDGEIRIWDTRTGEPRAVLGGHAAWVPSVTFSPDAVHLASGSFDRTVRIWDVATGRQVQELDHGGARVWFVAYGPHGDLLASGGQDAEVRLWDPGSGRLLATLRGHERRVFAIAISPDGSVLASASVDHTVRLWDLHHLACRAVLRGHTAWISRVAFSPDGATLASCGGDERIKLWDVRSGACVATLREDGPYAGMRIAGTTGVSTAQKDAMRALGAVDAGPESSPGCDRGSWAAR